MSSPLARLILVGGGHAHLEVLRRLSSASLPAEVLLISAYPRHHYSGMVPGYLGGIYTEDEIAFDLGRLAGGANARFLCDLVTRVDSRSRRLETAGNGWFEYDWVSFNIGSLAAGSTAPGVRRHVQLVKPISRAVELKDEVLELACQGRRRVPISVVGGGAAGVEVALAVDRLLRDRGVSPEVTLWEASGGILREYPRWFRRRAESILERRGISLRLDARVEAVQSASVRVKHEGQQASALTVWLAGAAAPPLFRESGLAVDDRGFLLVDDRLRCVEDDRLFGAGDCVTPAHYPETPKAGVYAVREAPVLWKNLDAAIQGKQPESRYRPQGQFLSILNTCDGKALLHYKGLVSHSRWAWWLKDWIDRRFVQKYQLGSARGAPVPGRPGG